MAITLRIPVAAFTLLAVYTVATSFDLAPKIEDILEKAGNLAGAIRASAAKYFARSNKFQGHDSSLMSTPEDDETLERGKTDLFDVDYAQDVPTTSAYPIATCCAIPRVKQVVRRCSHVAYVCFHAKFH